MPRMPRIKPPRPKPQPSIGQRLSAMRFKNLDHKDYQRTIAGRGDTHALDGGKIPFSKTKKGMTLFGQPILPVWEDRNSKNQGSKLNK